MNIRENATIKVHSGYYAGMTGKVDRIYPSLNMAIVSFDDVDVVGKVSLSSLEVVKPQETAAEPKSEIPEGAKRISKGDFEETLAVVTDTRRLLEGSDPMFSLSRILTAKIVGESVRDQIFKDQDAVVMTEDDFIVALWNVCNPVAVAEKIQNKMSISKTAKISVVAFSTLMELTEILYGGEND